MVTMLAASLLDLAVDEASSRRLARRVHELLPC